MPLTQTQINFVGSARQMIEGLILMRSKLDSFVLNFDNQQTPLPTDATVLDDAGASPRADAPQLTGANISQLRTFAAAMRDEINGTALNTLVELAVRDVSTIIRGS